MANSNLINDIVLPDSMVEFRNNTVITNSLRPHYDDTYEFKGAKAGATINLRTHQEFTVREDSLNIDVQDVEQKSVALARTKIFGVDFTYTDAELTQDVDGFMEYRVRPAMATLAAKVDQYVYETISDGVNQAVALPVTNIDSDDILNAGVKLDDASVPRDGQRTVILNPKGMKQLVSSSASLFNNARNISQQYNDGIVEVPSLGFNFGMSQNVNTHTVGSHDGAYDIATVPTSGDTTLDVDTGTGTFKKGDIITCAVNSVNKLTKQDTGELMQFTVTADSAGGTATIGISPAIISEGQYQNVVAMPALNDAVVVLGTLSTAYPQALAMHPSVGAVGFCDLVIPQGGIIDGSRKAEDGLSMRCLTGYDIMTSQQYIRFDVLMGAVAVEPTAGCRIYTP